MSSLLKNIATAIDYPESDGKPLGETDKHRRLILYLIFALERFFREQKDVYVSGNLMMYYEEGAPEKSVSPDVFLVRGVPKGDRRTYKIWEEKRAPDVVIEVSSRKTRREDFDKKMRLYADLRVKEYYIFDPEYPKRRPAFHAFRLSDGEYLPTFINAGCVLSQELGLELVDTGETLRWRDPKSGDFVPTPDEVGEALQQERKALQQERKALQQEREARRQAEAEIRQLREELARLKDRKRR